MRNSFTSKDWRRRADEVRAKAEQMTFDPRAQHIVLEIAAAYDKLAEMAEKRAKRLVSA
jgi:hypothetical protein